jgi:hypothetical protein
MVIWIDPTPAGSNRGGNVARDNAQQPSGDDSDPAARRPGPRSKGRVLPSAARACYAVS